MTSCEFDGEITYFGRMSHDEKHIVQDGVYFKNVQDIPKEKRGRTCAWERPWYALVIQKDLNQESDIRYRRIGLLIINGSSNDSKVTNLLWSFLLESKQAAIPQLPNRLNGQ